MRRAFQVILQFVLLAIVLAMSGVVRAAKAQEVVSLKNQFTNLCAQGKLVEALLVGERWLALVEAACGPQSTNTAFALKELAGVHQDLSGHAKAEELYRRALTILDTGGNLAPPQTAAVLAGLGSLFLRMGRLDEAEPLVNRALQLRAESLPPNHADLGESQSFLGWLNVQRGDYQKSEVHYLEALRIRRDALGRNHADTAGSFNDLALLYQKMGDYGRAEPLYLQALGIREEIFPPTHPDLARSYNDLGIFYKLNADYAKAAEYYGRALRIKEAVFGPDSPDLAITLNNFGTFYLQIGDYEQAEPLLARALKIKQAIPKSDPASLARGFHNLGLAYERLGKLELAESNYVRDLEISERSLGPNHPETAGSLSTLAGLYYRRKDYARAEKTYVRALAIEEAIAPDHPGTATTVHNLARLYADLGRLDEAERLYLHALKIRESVLGVHHDDTAKTIECLARLKLDLGDRSEARRLAARATEANETVLANILSFSAEEQRLRFQQRTDPYSLTATLGSAGFLAPVVLHNKGIVLDSLLEDHLVAASARDPDVREQASRLRLARRRFAEFLSKEPKNGTAQTLQLRAAELERLRAEVEQIESTLAREFAGLGRARRALAVTVGQVQRAIPMEAVLVEYLRYSHYLGTNEWEQRYGAVVFGRVNPPGWIPLGSASSIEKNIRLFQHFMRSKPDEVALADLLRALHGQLWSSVEKVLPKGTRHVIISPDAELNFLSFATLLNPSNRFLASDYSINYVASGRDLLATNSSPSGNRRLEVYANPDFGIAADVAAAMKPGSSQLRGAELRGLRDMTFRPLPGAEKEARLLETKAGKLGFRDVALRLGQQATEAELNQIESPHVLHLATHGFFLPDTDSATTPATNRSDSTSTALPLGSQVSPMRRSGLALAGAQRTLAAWAGGQTTSAENDGIVSAEEVGGLNLRNTWLVVLSACDTGAGEARAGEGVLGLRRGFAQAGAQNLLLTLWPIDDEQTTDLILDFYAEAARSRDAPTALAQVQVRWLDQLRRKKGLLEACRIAGPFILSFRGAIGQGPRL